MAMHPYSLVLALAAPALFAQTGTLRPEVMPAEDPQVRAEAVRLMERAVLVSTPVWPANEESFTFRILDPSLGETTTGQMNIGVARPALKRWDFTFGTYHYVQVQNGREFATVRTQESEPAALTSVRKLVPVFVGRFEQADVIRRIEDATTGDRPSRCIVFDTLKGDHQQPGRACVDAAQGWLLELTQGDETIRQSNFYRFNNGFLPGHIEKWHANRKLFEIDENIVVRTQYPADYFNYPENASIRHACGEFHRALAEDTEQPPQKTQSSDLIDVRVHGFVGKDGKPYGLKALDTARPDLAEEAVRIVSGWKYHPAMCEYDPATMETDFAIHFKGW
jgi:hypothetical protein